MAAANPDVTAATFSAPLDRERQAAPQIFERLRGAIISLQLPPGTVLSRLRLMEQFGVSQTPIRDAMLRLAEEKLVDVFAQHATVVSTIDLDLARQTHFLRQAVELEVVRNLALAGDRRFVAALRQELAVQKAMIDVGDPAVTRDSDLIFHKRLCDLAGVADLWALIRSRSGHLDRLRRLHLPPLGKGLADHFAVLDAIERGEADVAQALLRRHMSRTFGLIDEIRSQHPTYFR